MAGRSTARTMVASISTAAARPMPSSFMSMIGSVAKIPNTPTITIAALVMVAVFAIFGSLGVLFLKEMGVGLAVAVFIDATIVRAVLLPASMKLLGDWNWYLPRWLEWLPRLEHEPRPEAEKAPDAAPVLQT